LCVCVCVCWENGERGVVWLAGGPIPPSRSRHQPVLSPHPTRTQPKPDPDAPSTRTTRGRGGVVEDGATPRRGGAAPPAVKPDPDADGGAQPAAATARRGRGAAAAVAAAAAAAAAAPPPPTSTSTSGSDDDAGARILTASDRLRTSAAPQFAYAAKLVRHAPPPVELCPPPRSIAATPSSAHFPVSAFGTGLGGGLTLLQLPARLPVAPGDRTPPPPGSPADPEDGCASIADLPPGVIGRLLVLKSGAVKVHIGGVEFDLVPGMPVDALAAGVRLTLPSSSGRNGAGGGAAAAGPSTSPRRGASGGATSAAIGQVISRATLVPDVGRLLRGEAAPAYRKAPGFTGPRQLDAAAAAAAAGPPRGTPGGRGRAVVASDEEEEEDAVAAEAAARAVGRVVMEESE